MLCEKFKERMRDILGDEYDIFISALETGDAVRGVRINTIKAAVSDILTNTPFELTPLGYAEDGFILRDGDGIGSSPEHHAGIFYVQDPGAMATANSLDIRDGWRVLDLCASPGGKSGQAAAKIGHGGFILSNEYVPKRAKTVVSNFERLGIRCGMVTSLDTSEFPRMFSAFFDLVIVDAPCSGEGMFRKSEEAISDWSEENIRHCKQRQEYILENAVSLVKPGGYLLYSTCTYAPEENEMTVDAFLKRHSDYSLAEVKDSLVKITAPGIRFSDECNEDIDLTRRFYPHRAEGEGQFIALMKRREDIADKPKILYKDSAKPLTKEEEALVKEFFKKNLRKAPEGRAVKVGDGIVILSHSVPVPPKSVFSAGVLLGNIEKKILFPHHQFFSAYGDLFIRQEHLDENDSRTERYLRGEEIEARGFEDSGYCSVIYRGASLGGGKASGGKIKNHYPKGLRKNK